MIERDISNSSNGGILIVDDMPANLQLLSDILMREGYGVRVAPDGFFALESVAQRLPDLILLDVKMPGMDGFEVCRKLKENPASQAVPVIFLSAFQETSDKLTGFAAGGVDYIGKPFIAEEVVARVRTHLALHDLRQRLEVRVDERTRALRMLSAGNMAVLYGGTVAELIASLVRVMVSEGGYLAARVILGQEASGRIEQAGAGDDRVLALAVQGGFYFPFGGSNLHDCDLSPDDLAAWGKLGVASVIAVPLACGSDASVRGTVTAFCRQSLEGVPQGEFLLLNELAANVGYGIGALHSRQTVERTFEQTIQAVAAMVEMRDPYTAGHQRRVAEIAVAIGQRLGLDEARIKGLYLAGVIHDIGKIAVPAEILSRPGRLSDYEMAIIREHAAKGRDIIKGISFPWPVPTIVVQHHERMDGSGYPAGLAGDDILLESRIIAVADVIEAISSHRPYRSALGLKAGLEELTTFRGIRYDAAVVDACVQLAAENLFDALFPV